MTIEKLMQNATEDGLELRLEFHHDGRVAYRIRRADADARATFHRGVLEPEDDSAAIDMVLGDGKTKKVRFPPEVVTAIASHRTVERIKKRAPKQDGSEIFPRGRP